MLINKLSQKVERELPKIPEFRMTMEQSRRDRNFHSRCISPRTRRPSPARTRRKCAAINYFN